MNGEQERERGGNSVEAALAELGGSLRRADLSGEAQARTREAVCHVLREQGAAPEPAPRPWPLWAKVALPLSVAAALMLAVTLKLKQPDVLPASDRSVAGPTVRPDLTDPAIGALHDRIVADVNAFRRNYIERESLSMFERRKNSLRGRLLSYSGTIRRELAVHDRE